MDYRKETVYMAECKDTAIMLCLEGDAWEVYYKKLGYPYMYAFGVPSDHSVSDVIDMAIANVDEYQDMFD